MIIHELSSLIIQVTSLSLQPSHRVVEYHYSSRVVGSLPLNEYSSLSFPSYSRNISGVSTTLDIDFIPSISILSCDSWRSLLVSPFHYRPKPISKLWLQAWIFRDKGRNEVRSRPLTKTPATSIALFPSPSIESIGSRSEG